MTSGHVIFLNKDSVGRGDDQLGQMLMKAFLSNVAAVEPLPSHIVFMNSGVRLATEGSGVLDILRGLEQRKVRLLVCGTCLDYFGLKEKLAVGSVTNQNEAVSIFTAASKVITV